MSVTFQEVGIGSLMLSQLGILMVAVKALARRKASDASDARDRAERVVCPVTMNGFKAVMEQMAQGQHDQTEQLRQINERLAVVLERIGGVR